jgi:signal transduction histidine kinase
MASSQPPAAVQPGPATAAELFAAAKGFAAARDLDSLMVVVETLTGMASTGLGEQTPLDELRRAIEARDDFMSAASHELRTPLTALFLHLDRLDRALHRGERPDLGAALPRLRAAARRLERLVESLLDVSRVAQHRLVLEREPVDLAALAEEVVARVLETTSTPIVVRRGGAVVGRWDRLRVEQVVENLVGNAVKFGGEAPVEVAVDATPEMARLVVRDRGIGIPAHDQARIFEPFERAVPALHFGGIGLGLWIVRHAVEAHGGSIAVESQPGEGATFTVLLPREPGRRAATPEP